MDNDKFNYNNEESDFFESQQYNQRGGRPTPPEPPDRGGRPTPSESPNRGGPPPTAPPGFVPDMPSTGGQPFSGVPDYNTQFRGGGQNQSRNYWGCINRFTYIWLINGNNFWFYPVFIGWQQMEGFRWRNGRWVYERINLRRILVFRCV